MKTLVVDDTVANRQLLSWILEDLGHHVIEAGNGEEAVAAFEKEGPDLILLDIMMPIMDGYEAAKRIKQQSQGKYIPIIFLTAITDQEGLSNCLAAGGDDFLTKPINEQILKAKIEAHARIKLLTDELNSKNKDLETYKWQMDNEREMAENVFNNALKTNFLKSNNTDFLISPASQFNGDILLGAPSPTGSHYLLIGDFTGHGLPASIGALPLSKVFFEATKKGLNVGDIAKAINAELNQFLPDNMICAATIIEQSKNGRDITVWAGGLPDGFILQNDGLLINRIESQHMPLAALEDHEFERDVAMYHLEEDEYVVLYTDGIIEASNEDLEMFGEERFLALLNRSPEASINELMNVHADWSDRDLQEDDITILKLTSKELVLFDEQAEKTNDNVTHLPWVFKVELGINELKTADPLSQTIDLLGTIDSIKSHKDYLYTVLSELYSNALEHGILDLDSSLKDSEQGYLEYYEERAKRLDDLEKGFIKIDISLKPEIDLLRVNISVANSGPGFDYTQVKSATEDDSHGRGLGLLQHLCDSLEFSEGGTKVSVSYLASTTENESIH